MDTSEKKFTKLPSKLIRDGVYRSITFTDNLMLTIFEFTNGPWERADPFHSHVHEQVTYVADGEIIFYCEDQKDQHLKAGDVYAVPSGKKHTIKVLTEKVKLVDSFTPIRQDFLK